MTRTKEGEPNRIWADPKIASGLTLGTFVLSNFLAACGEARAVDTPTPRETERPPTQTFTPEPSPTKIPILTRTPSLAPTPTEILTPTPDFATIDSNNQSSLEQARGGEIIDLPNANITSIWKFPWFAEKGEPKDAFVAFIWGEETSSGIATSAECIFEHYRKEDNLGKQVWLFPQIWRPSERLTNLKVEVSDLPSPIKVVDAEEITTDPDSPAAKCEEVKELERLQKFLSSIDWKELPSDLSEATGRELGKIIKSFLEGLEEAGIDVPFFP